MFYSVFVVLSVVAFGGCVFIPEDCPPNEEYLLCGPCPTNCSNPDPELSCGDCEEGCFCIAGFLRNENGTCVTPEHCDLPAIQCAENEEFLPCASACQPTCSQRDPVACDFVCKTGCFCQQGFLMDESNGNCVLPFDCPPVPCLNSNEVYESCNGACEPTCYNPEPVCTKICVGGCVCAPGLRRVETGECVPIDQCPTRVGNDTSLLDKYLDTLNRLLKL